MVNRQLQNVFKPWMKRVIWVIAGNRECRHEKRRLEIKEFEDFEVYAGVWSFFSTP
jgi:hypothetical protein